MDAFPPEIVSRILVSLADHRTVVRCCAVSKQWNSIIRSDAFGLVRLRPCRRAPHMWQTDGMHVMEDVLPDEEAVEHLSEHELASLNVARKGRRGMVKTETEAWTCGRITTREELVDDTHVGPCAGKDGWFALLRELAFMEYLEQLVGREDRYHERDPYNYSVRPVLFGTNLSGLVEADEVNEECHMQIVRTATGNVYSTRAPLRVAPFELPSRSAECDPFAHVCYDVAKRRVAPPECYPWDLIRNKTSPNPNQRFSDYEGELRHADIRLQSGHVHTRLRYDPNGMGQQFLHLLGLREWRQDQPSVAIMPSLHTAFRRLEEFGKGQRIYVVYALYDANFPRLFPGVDLDLFWVVQSPRTGRLVGLGTFIFHQFFGMGW
ncbi:hypothetical protein DFJ77DRAFT_443883 [Powellomyces hirtus]|nr:hypothetical protein DFJ77DRAFT_443883 [Powellomyces hirtus]